MTLPIGSIGSSFTSPVLRPAGGATPGASPAGIPGAGNFGESLSKLIDSVESSEQTANSAVSQMLDGTGDVHDAMIALQRAELTLQLTVQVRNKMVQAYQDIMRMPV